MKHHPRPTLWRSHRSPPAVSLAVAGVVAAVALASTVTAAEATKYTGTIYVAGHGGHVAKAEVTVDPANAAAPLVVKALPQDGAKLTVSMKKHENGSSQYKLHDVRLDGNTLYWSTYNTDVAGKIHYGTVNLSDADKVTADIAVPVDPRATQPAVKPDAMPYYCASAQTKGYFMPMTMSHEAYITVVDKQKPDKSFNVFLDSVLPDANYKFLHGSTDPTGTKFLAVVNLSDVPQGRMTGEHLMLILDAKALEQGKLVKLAEGTVFGDGSGPFGASITFRSTWSADGSRIFLAGGDRVWIIDANDPKLKPLNGPDGDIRIGGQAHDMLPTSDGKYALVTLRVLPYEGSDDAKKHDGMVQLYDVANSKVIGTPVSVCNVCHKAAMGTNINAMLCGLDGKLQPVTAVSR
jgi:hypothetical protein